MKRYLMIALLLGACNDFPLENDAVTDAAVDATPCNEYFNGACVDVDATPCGAFNEACCLPDSTCYANLACNANICKHVWCGVGVLCSDTTGI